MSAVESRPGLVSRDEVEAELDAAIGGPLKREFAKAKLRAMRQSREEAVSQAFKNGCFVGSVVTSTLATIAWILLVSV